jgi:hypothetical protein
MTTKATKVTAERAGSKGSQPICRVPPSGGPTGTGVRDAAGVGVAVGARVAVGVVVGLGV